MSKIILCDVDLTIVNPIPLWWRWMEIQVGATLDFNKELEQRGVMPYDLSKCFKDAFGELKFDSLEFWRNEGIYDLMTPIPLARVCLQQLHKEGYEIRFVSHCKGNHHKSKYNFVERNFPFLAGFAGTKEKWMLAGDVDIFIDDRNEHLNKMPDRILKLQHHSFYEQFEPLTAPNSHENCDWHTIYEIIKRQEKQ